MANSICPECKNESLIEKRGEYETVYADRDGHSQNLKVPDVTWLECTNCGEVILDDRAMSSIEAARRIALGLLTPGEIRAFRTHLHKTQRGMSELLGIGEKTYCRWESGAYVQSVAFDRYLRLLMADDSNVYMLQEIAQGKPSAEVPDGLDELQKTFTSIRDIRIAAGLSRQFTVHFTRGQLLRA